MKAHILKGSKQEIAESLIRLGGEVREAIVFEEDPEKEEGTTAAVNEDIFAEMLPYMVPAHDIDDSRDAIYGQMDGE